MNKSSQMPDPYAFSVWGVFKNPQIGLYYNSFLAYSTLSVKF